MQDFINSTIIWISTDAVSIPDQKQCKVNIRLQNRSLLSSYLNVVDPDQRQCIIPIRNDIVLKLSDNALEFSFIQYQEQKVAFSFSSEESLQLIVSHFIKFALLTSQSDDQFEQENSEFLSQFSPPTLETRSVNSKCTGLLPITTSVNATNLWEQLVHESNTQFFIDQIPLRFSFLTWNVASNQASNDVLSDLVKCFHTPCALNDFIFIAFEEIDMSMKSVVTGSTQARGRWYDSILSAQALEDDRYEMLTYESIGGVFCAILVKKAIKNRIPIKLHHISTIKLGAAGMLCNKAAILIPLTIGEMEILTISAHLAPHDPNWEQRNEQFHEILQHVSELETTQSFKDSILENSQKPDPNFHFHHVIMMGDLNYRIADFTYENVVNMVSEHKIDELFAHDQLRITMSKDPDRIGQFDEPEIKFNPTYKFDKRSDRYDTSSKKRIPSWTDRVLIRTSPPSLRVGLEDKIYLETDAVHNYMTSKFYTDSCFELPRKEPNFPQKPELICYRMLRCNFSDHRPVLAVYKFQVPYLVQEKKAELEEFINCKKDEHRRLSIPKGQISLVSKPSNLKINSEVKKTISPDIETPIIAQDEEESKKAESLGEEKSANSDVETPDQEKIVESEIQTPEISTLDEEKVVEPEIQMPEIYTQEEGNIENSEMQMPEIYTQDEGNIENSEVQMPEIYTLDEEKKTNSEIISPEVVTNDEEKSTDTEIETPEIYTDFDEPTEDPDLRTIVVKLENTSIVWLDWKLSRKTYGNPIAYPPSGRLFANDSIEIKIVWRSQSLIGDMIELEITDGPPAKLSLI